jgi:hypothetical protein
MRRLLQHQKWCGFACAPSNASGCAASARHMVAAMAAETPVAGRTPGLQNIWNSHGAQHEGSWLETQQVWRARGQEGPRSGGQPVHDHWAQ